MTIKNQNKNISAEVDITQLFDIEVEQDHGEITAVKLTRRDFYNDEAKTTYDLMDYFYTEQEIDNFVKVHLVVYDSFSQLPQNNGISAGKSNYIYLVPYVDSEGVKEGIYKEYVWVQIKNSAKYRTNETDHNDYVLDGAHYNYESLGSTEIDLSQIRQDIVNLQSNKLDKTKVIDNLTTSTYNSSDPTALSAKQGKNLQDNKIDKTSIATNLTTNDDTKVLSAKQGKNLQDNKIDKTSIATNLTTNDDTKVLSAKQGKQLQDNKVDKSSIVDNVTDANTNPVTSNAVFDTISDILDQLQSSSLLLNSNQPIIQNGQTSRLIARIYGDIISNDNILFYEKKTGATDVLLDTVSVTNGVATYSYSGTGAGKKEFYVKHGSVVSQPYTVTDCIAYDKGILNDPDTHTSQWQINTSRSSIEAQEDGTLLQWISQFSIDYFVTPSATSEYCYSGDNVFEFDAVSVKGEIRMQLVDSSDNIIEHRIYGNSFVANSHFKFSFQNGVVTAQINDGTPFTINPSPSALTGNYAFRFRMPTTSTTDEHIKFKNMKVYPI